MAQISSIDGIWVKGVLVKAASDFATFTRPGVVGTGVVLGVKHDEVQTIVAEYLYSDKSSADSAAKSYQDLEGTNVEIIDQFGTTYDKATVCRCVARVTECVHPDTPWLVSAEFSVVLETA